MHTVVYVISSLRVGRTTLRNSATTWRRNSAIRANSPRRAAPPLVPRAPPRSVRSPRVDSEAADAPLGRASRGSPTSPVLVWLTRPSPVVVVHGTHGTHSRPGAGAPPGRTRDGAAASRRVGTHPRRGATQGRRDLNPQPPVLETGALPIELLPFGRLVAARPAAPVPSTPDRGGRQPAARSVREPGPPGRTGERPLPRAPHPGVGVRTSGRSAGPR